MPRLIYLHLFYVCRPRFIMANFLFTGKRLQQRLKMAPILDDWSTAALLAIVIVIATTYFALEKRKSRLKKSQLPRPPALPSLPIVGSLPFMSYEDLSAFFLEKSKTLGKVFSLYAGSRYGKILVWNLIFEYLCFSYQMLFQCCFRQTYNIMLRAINNQPRTWMFQWRNIRSRIQVM